MRVLLSSRQTCIRIHFAILKYTCSFVDSNGRTEQTLFIRMEWQFDVISGDYCPRQFEFRRDSEGMITSVMKFTSITVYLFRYYLRDNEWRCLFFEF